MTGSHKRRDKRCHIAAPLLRSALHTVLAHHDISIDETGQSLSVLDGPPIEELEVSSEEEREKLVSEKMAGIEGVGGGKGGEVGVFDINHLGGHRYAGVMLVSVVQWFGYLPVVGWCDPPFCGCAFDTPYHISYTIESRRARYLLICGTTPVLYWIALNLQTPNSCPPIANRTNTQILFPSGAYLSYGRVSPHEIPLIVEETILKGKVVPGLLRNAVGVVAAAPRKPLSEDRVGAEGEKKCAVAGKGFLGW
jgi:hypothetical protein